MASHPEPLSEPLTLTQTTAEQEAHQQQSQDQTSSDATATTSSSSAANGMNGGDSQLPKSYKAIIYDSPGKISTKIVDMDMPEPGPGECLVNLTHSGVCHSDYGVMTCSWSILPYPTMEGQVGGHEGIGRVVKLGPGADANVKIGDRVGIKWVAFACGSCAPCLAGSEGLCFNQKISGYYYPGTFQQYAIAPAHYVTPIPEGLDSAAAAPMLCGGVTVYSALRKSGASAGQWVVITGAGGGLGHLAVQIAARGMGYRVIGVDHSSKESLVKSCGAEHFFGFDKYGSSEELIEAVKKATSHGHGAKAAIVCNASNASYGQALAMLSFSGTLVCVGIPEGKPVEIAGAMPGQMLAKELRVVGSSVGNRREAIETLEMASRGVVTTHFRTEKMGALNKIFEDMNEGKLMGRVVLDLSE